MLPEKIHHIRRLRIQDFEELDDEATDEGEQQFQPDQHASPPLLLVSPEVYIIVMIISALLLTLVDIVFIMLTSLTCLAV